ncbi:hypothetical protein JCM6882_006936 [Rhodosporidiobolus microsporus]
MASFPRVGDTFSSIEAFKVAVQTACYHQGLRMSTVSSNTGHDCSLGCPLAGFRACSAGVTARLVEGSGSKLFKVVQQQESHTCGSKKRRSDGIEARELAARRLGKLGAAVPTLSSPEASRPANGAQSNSSSLFDPSSPFPSQVSSVFDTSPLPSARASKRASKPPERYGVQKARQEASSSAEEQSDVGEAHEVAPAMVPQPKTAIPTREELQEEFEELSQTRRVPLPNLGARYSSLRTLLIDLHAHAAQAGFFFTRRCGGSGSEPLRMECRESRHRSTLSARCRMRVKARKDGSGGWVVEEVEATHSHRLRPPPPDRLPATVVPSPPTNGGKSAAPPPSNPFSPAFLSPFSPHAKVPTVQPFPLPPGCHVPSQPIPPSLPASSVVTSSDLSSFLLACDSSLSASDLPFLHKFFSLTYISTVGDLAALVEMEEASVQTLVDEVKEREGWTAAETLTVVRGVVQVRKGFKKDTSSV